MTKTDIKKLPDKEGYNAVMNWLKDDDDVIPDTWRLVIVGPTGTGKTRAAKDYVEKFKSKTEGYVFLTADRFHSIMKQDNDCEYGFSSIFECIGDNPDDLVYYGYNKECTGCGMLKLHAGDEGRVIIDDLQEWTQINDLRYLKLAFEYLPFIIVTIQHPEGMSIQDVRGWLTNRLAGYNGKYQAEAEAIIRRLFEPSGLTVIAMQRGNRKTETEKNEPDNKSGSHEDIQEFPAEEQPADQNMQQTAQNPPIEHKHVKPLPVEYAYTEGYDEPETVFINEF